MPMRDALSLDDLNLFVFMAEEGSISGASRRFGISKAKLSRALSRLEERAGLPLFDRVAGGLRLTATGQALQPVAQRLAQTSSEAEEILRAAVGEPTGQLRVAASALSGQLLIAPVIAELHRLHRGVQVVVTVSALGPDPLSEDLDVVLRLGRPPEPYLIARKIASSPLALYASRPVAEALNRSRALEQVDAQRIVIGVPGVPADWDMHDGSGVTHTLRGAPKSVVGDPSVALGILKAGQGVSLLPEIFGKPLERRNELARVRPDLSGPEVEIFACFPPRRASVPAVRVFIDGLVAFANRGGLAQDRQPGVAEDR